MSKLQGTQTLGNLMKAFAGESQARNRYTMFAAIANKEGYPQIQNVFLETAENERMHAKTFYEQITKTLKPNETVMVNVNADYPVVLGDTLTNLKAAAAGEHDEYANLYTHFADVAESEGFADIAFIFRKIAEIEAEHEKRYLAFADALEKGTLFKKQQAVEWKCSKCGYVHTGVSAPSVCPVCGHPQGYFEMNISNW